MDISPTGRVIFTNTTIRGLIGSAFGVRNIEGAPAWTGTDRYDVVATAGRQVTPQERNEMLRSLLVDRLKLRTHVETRDQPAYALVLLRSDGRLGPGITRSTLDCEAVAAAMRPGVNGPLASNGAPACGISLAPGLLKVSGMSVTAGLSGAAGRPVLDRTGLTGNFDYTLRYSPNPDQPIADYPAAVTAIQEQLGFKLEPTTAPAQFLIIDAIERPSDN